MKNWKTYALGAGVLVIVLVGGFFAFRRTAPTSPPTASMTQNLNLKHIDLLSFLGKSVKIPVVDDSFGGNQNDSSNFGYVIVTPPQFVYDETGQVFADPIQSIYFTSGKQISDYKKNIAQNEVEKALNAAFQGNDSLIEQTRQTLIAQLDDKITPKSSWLDSLRSIFSQANAAPADSEKIVSLKALKLVLASPNAQPQVNQALKLMLLDLDARGLLAGGVSSPLSQSRGLAVIVFPTPKIDISRAGVNFPTSDANFATLIEAYPDLNGDDIGISSLLYNQIKWSISHSKSGEMRDYLVEKGVFKNTDDLVSTNPSLFGLNQPSVDTTENIFREQMKKIGVDPLKTENVIRSLKAEGDEISANFKESVNGALRESGSPTNLAGTTTYGGGPYPDFLATVDKINKVLTPTQETPTAMPSEPPTPEQRPQLVEPAEIGTPIEKPKPTATSTPEVASPPTTVPPAPVVQPAQEPAVPVPPADTGQPKSWWEQLADRITGKGEEPSPLSLYSEQQLIKDYGGTPPAAGGKIPAAPNTSNYDYSKWDEGVRLGKNGEGGSVDANSREAQRASGQLPSGDMNATRSPNQQPTIYNTTDAPAPSTEEPPSVTQRSVYPIPEGKIDLFATPEPTADKPIIPSGGTRQPSGDRSESVPVSSEGKYIDAIIRANPGATVEDGGSTIKTAWGNWALGNDGKYYPSDESVFNSNAIKNKNLVDKSFWNDDEQRTTGEKQTSGKETKETTQKEGSPVTQLQINNMNPEQRADYQAKLYGETINSDPDKVTNIEVGDKKLSPESLYKYVTGLGPELLADKLGITEYALSNQLRDGYDKNARYYNQFLGTDGPNTFENAREKALELLKNGKNGQNESWLINSVGNAIASDIRATELELKDPGLQKDLTPQQLQEKLDNLKRQKEELEKYNGTDEKPFMIDKEKYEYDPKTKEIKLKADWYCKTREGVYKQYEKKEIVDFLVKTKKMTQKQADEALKKDEFGVKLPQGANIKQYDPDSKKNTEKTINKNAKGETQTKQDTYSTKRDEKPETRVVSPTQKLNCR
jgi:hypothetical protein